MMDEAAEHGVRFRERLPKLLVLGENLKDNTFEYVAPDASADLYESVIRAWKILEYLPKHAKRHEWPGWRSFLGFFLPRCEPRPIAPDAVIHDSVAERQSLCDDRTPENLPPRS